MKIFSLLFFPLLLFGCTKKSQFGEVANPTSEVPALTDGFSAQGQPLKNPFSIDNMRKAYQSLEKNTQINIEGIIRPTHYYVRFMPADEAALDLLKQDTSLNLYPYPLDVAFEENADLSNYRDQGIPKGQPGYYYASLPIAHPMPKVRHEILETLHIPDEGRISRGRGRSTTPSYGITPEVLVDRSMQLTENEEYAPNYVPPPNGNINPRNRGRWRPAGRIMIGDNILRRDVPLVGAEVRARRWFTTHRGTTNGEGRYSCNGTFRRPANYSIVWEQYNFSVRVGEFGQAVFNGGKRRGDWNVTLGNSWTNVVDKQQYYALVFQAARDYYAGWFELQRPPLNAVFKRQLKIAAKNKSGTSSYAQAKLVYFGAPVSIQTFGSSPDVVYAVTIHGLAHAAHRLIDRNIYNAIVGLAYTVPLINPLDNFQDPRFPSIRNTRRLMETWAVTVEIYFAQHRYITWLGERSYRYGHNNFQNVRPQRSGDDAYYTPIGYDMLDNYNQRERENDDGIPIDRVSGYTLKQLEQALRGAKTWNQWRDNIKRMYDNPTESYLDELFANWRD